MPRRLRNLVQEATTTVDAAKAIFEVVADIVEGYVDQGFVEVKGTGILKLVGFKIPLPKREGEQE